MFLVSARSNTDLETLQLKGFLIDGSLLLGTWISPKPCGSVLKTLEGSASLAGVGLSASGWWGSGVLNGVRLRVSNAVEGWESQKILLFLLL